MLNFVGRGSAHTCDGTTRRDFLQVGSLGVAGLSLADYIEAKEQGQVADGHDERSCIMIFNLGAPSQLDTFDMKPDAPLEVRGPFKPISTSCGNYQLSEILPKHADPLAEQLWRSADGADARMLASPVLVVLQTK